MFYPRYMYSADGSSALVETQEHLDSLVGYADSPAAAAVIQDYRAAEETLVAKAIAETELAKEQADLEAANAEIARLVAEAVE
jgi:hypothetical protein